MRVFLVVEGTVGSGKTSLIERIHERFGFTPFYELSDPMVEDMLSHFYSDRKRWAFTLQILFLTIRFEQIKRAGTISRAVLDRSIFGDVIFAKMLHNYGDMKDSEMMVYERLYNSLISSVPPPFLMIYLRCPTDLAIERIEKRGRSYELIVEREYWERLNAEYERYFENYSLSPLLIIRSEKHDWVNRPEDADYVLEKIHEFLTRSIRGELFPGWREEI